ncbi:TPA: hypothetical protein AB5A35_003429 [Vibrio cholerae]
MKKINNPLEEKYEEFLDLLRCLGESYDASGKEILSLSISTAIRVLVHDTKSSTSLLAHLNRKERLFLSTNNESQNESVHLGLVRRINVGVCDGKGGEAKYWPLCDERYFASPDSQSYVEFETWWSKEEIFRSPKASLTRKDLVLAIANKDGGAHFDKEVTSNYDDFRKKWSGGSCLVGINSGIKRGYDNIPTLPAIRQIAYELLTTLQP